jgi:hypothetical protein
MHAPQENVKKSSGTWVRRRETPGHGSRRVMHGTGTASSPTLSQGRLCLRSSTLALVLGERRRNPVLAGEGGLELADAAALSSCGALLNKQLTRSSQPTEPAQRKYAMHGRDQSSRTNHEMKEEQTSKTTTHTSFTIVSRALTATPAGGWTLGDAEGCACAAAALRWLPPPKRVQPPQGPAAPGGRRPYAASPHN